MIRVVVICVLLYIAIPYTSIAQEQDTIFQNVTLSEILVKVPPVRHTANKDIYIVTDSLIAHSSNTLELLDRFHGIRYDRINNNIKITNKSNILFIIDGREQSVANITSLNPNQIQRIEIIRTPKGKYASEGYDAVINVVMRKDFRGYNISLNNFMLLNLSKKNNGDDWLMSEQPSVNVSYTNKKINIYGSYTNGLAYWNTPMERSVIYEDVFTMSSVALDDVSSNDQYRYRGNVASLGINLNLDKTRDHVLSFEANYEDSRVKNRDVYNYNVQNFKTNSVYNLQDTTINTTDNASWSGSIFYNGRIGEYLKLYADLICNNFDNDVVNQYNTANTHVSNIYNEKRNVVKYSFEADQILSEKISLNYGVTGNYRKFNSPEIDFNYKEYRQKFHMFAKYLPMEKLQTEFGLGGEYINAKNVSQSKSYFHLLPLVQINYQPNEKLNLHTSYSTDMEYPSLEQLNPQRTIIDSLMYQQGNSNLKSSLSHSFKLSLNYLEMLSLAVRYKYAPNYICDLIKNSDNGIYSSYENINYKEYAIEASADIPLNKHWMVSLAGTYYSSYAKFVTTDYHVDGGFIDVDLQYTIGGSMAQFGYHKNMDKRNMLQGFQYYDFDSWSLMLNKQFFNNRLSMTLNYLLPLKWGVKERQIRSIITSNYKESHYTSVKPYRSALMFQLTYRFNAGKVHQQRKKSSVEREERIKKSFSF